MKIILKLIKNLNINISKVVVLFLLSIFSSLLSITPIKILGILLNRIYEYMNGGRVSSYIINILVIYGIFVIVGTAIRNLFCYYSSKFSNTLIKRLRDLCYVKLLNMDYSVLQSLDSANVINTVLNNTARLELIFSTTLFTMLSDIFDLLVMSYFILLISPMILLFFIIVLPFTYFLAKRSSSVQKLLAKDKIAIESKMISNLNQTYHNLDIIRIFNGQSNQKKQFENLTHNYENLSNESDYKLSYFYVVEKTARLLGIFISLIYLIYNIINGNIDIGSFMSIVLYSERFFSPITNFIRYFQIIQKGVASAEDINKFIGFKNDKSKKIISNFLNQSPVILQGSEISVYADDKLVSAVPYFEILSSCVNHVVGENGAGKSSFLKGLMGIYQLESGQIVADFSIKENYDIFSYAKQNDQLLDTSVIDNCLYPFTIQTASKEKKEFAKKMLKKLNFTDEQIYANVGEQSVKISGGEKNKISFIRSILYDAPVLILDEVTANVDNESKQIMEKIIVDECKNRTVIMVNHEPSKYLLQNICNTINLKKIYNEV